MTNRRKQDLLPFHVSLFCRILWTFVYINVRISVTSANEKNKCTRHFVKKGESNEKGNSLN